jgi:uncharacterized integral membrane protein
MRRLRHAVFLVVILMLLICVLAFVLENQQDVSLSFFGWSLPPLPVAFAVIAPLLIGMVIGPIIGGLYARVNRGRQRHKV